MMEIHGRILLCIGAPPRYFCWSITYLRGLPALYYRETVINDVIFYIGHWAFLARCYTFSFDEHRFHRNKLLSYL